MEPEDRKRIQANYVLLVRNLEVREIIPHLHQNHLLSDEEMGMITLEGITKQHSCRKLLSIIVKKRTTNQEKSSFQVLCTAITKGAQDFIVEAMMNTKVSQVWTNTANENLDDRKRIHENRQYLANNINTVSIMDHLHQYGVLNDEDMEMISPDQGLTSQTRCRRLLAIIREKGNNRQGQSAYHFFYKALQDNGHEWVFEKLMTTDVNEVELGDEPDLEIQNRNEKHLEMLINEVEQLKEKLGKRKKSDCGDALKIKYPRQLEATTDGSGLGDDGKDTLDTGALQARVIASETERLAKSIGIYIVQYMNNPSKYKITTDKYCLTVASVVNDMSKRFDKEFHAMIKVLDGSEGFKALENVGDLLLRDEVKWGRIVSLYAFAGYLGKYIVDDSESKVAKNIGNHIGQYVTDKCGKWIDENGGWDSCLKNDENKEATPAVVSCSIS